MTERTRPRLFVFKVLVISLLAALIGRLWVMQIVDGSSLSAAATTNAARSVITPSIRGEIVSAGGQPLVSNTTALVVTVNRTMLQAQPNGGLGVLRRLAAVLGEPEATLAHTIEICTATVGPPCWNGSPYQPVPVAEFNPNTQQAKVLEIEENLTSFPGVSAQLEAVLNYPYGDLAAHSLGYLAPITPAELASKRYANYSPSDEVGATGLEASYESYLHGQDGVEKVAVDSAGTVTGVLSNTAPQPGDNVVLSLDVRVQKMVEHDLVAQIMADRAKGLPAPAGSVVVEDPRNGRIIAMASYPTYNPSLFIGGISYANYARLTSPAAGDPLLDQATQAEYSQGSTFKLATASATAMDGTAPLNGLYDCSPYFRVGNTIKHNAGYEFVPTPITLAYAIAMSCDTVFYRLGYDEYVSDENRIAHGLKPRQAIANMARAYGWGSYPGIDIPEQSAGLVASRGQQLAQWEALKADYCAGAKRRPKGTFLQRLDAQDCATGYLYTAGDAVIDAIGQGSNLTTCLQLADAYSALANGGTLYSPRLAEAIVAPDGRVVKRIVPPVVRHVPVSQAVLAYIRNAMVGTTEQTEGTAYYTFLGFPFSKLAVGAKTGTASYQGAAFQQPTALFASFAPAGHPQYVVAAIVAQAGYGDTGSAPMVRKIWDNLYGLEGHSPVLGHTSAPYSTLPTMTPTGTFAAPSATSPPVAPPATGSSTAATGAGFAHTTGPASLTLPPQDFLSPPGAGLPGLVVLDPPVLPPERNRRALPRARLT